MRVTIFLLVIVIISGCAAVEQHRTRVDLCVNSTAAFSPECETHALQEFKTEKGGRFVLGFIEFDDQGQLFDRKQMDLVMDKLREQTATKEMLVMVFVHGWKHTAAVGDGNIDTFRKVLAGSSDDEPRISRETGRPPREVVGIYLGWRGAAIPIPLVDNLTFWDRKEGAERVARGGAVTRLLVSIENIKKTKESVTDNTHSFHLVIIGHSFGGALVHAALAQLLESGTVNASGFAGMYRDVQGFGTLVVLINPALEALRFAQLSDAMTERTYFSSQFPRIAVLTSEADYATRFAFPIGRNLSTWVERMSYRDIKRRNAQTGREEIIREAEANSIAIGHFQPYQTHTLYPTVELPRGAAAQLSSSKSIASTREARSGWIRDRPGSKIPFGSVTLERSKTSAARNPSLVIQVDRNLIRDHNHIDDGRMIEFIKELVLISLPDK